jgi:hypothetical protein
MFGMNTPTNEIDEIRSKDLSPAMMARVSAPKKTFFFRRGDGMEFACEEREAWEICNNRSTWKRRDFTLIGTSDGTTYARLTKESLNTARALEPQIATKKAELDRYMKAEERLVVDEAVDMEGDPTDTENEANKKKVLRLRTIIDRLHNELDVIEEEYRSAVSDVVKRATAAELEVAKKNFAEKGPEYPDQNANIFTPDAGPAQRNKILNIMGGRV